MNFFGYHVNSYLPQRIFGRRYMSVSTLVQRKMQYCSSQACKYHNEFIINVHRKVLQLGKMKEVSKKYQILIKSFGEQQKKYWMYLTKPDIVAVNLLVCLQINLPNSTLGVESFSWAGTTCNRLCFSLNLVGGGRQR